MALVQLGDVTSLPLEESKPRSRTSSRFSRTKSASSGTRRGEDAVMTEKVKSLLNEALKHTELARVFPGT